MSAAACCSFDKFPNRDRGRAIRQWNRQARFGFEERVLDVLRLHLDVDRVRGVLPGAVEIAAADPRLAQLVRFRRMHHRRVRRHRFFGREHGFEHFVLDLDELRRLAGRALIVRRHHRQDVADAMRLLAFADEHRPVLVDQPDAFFTGHIPGRDDLHNTGQPFRRLGASIFNTFARGCAENTKAPCTMPGTFRSSM